MTLVRGHRLHSSVSMEHNWDVQQEKSAHSLGLEVSMRAGRASGCMGGC